MRDVGGEARARKWDPDMPDPEDFSIDNLHFVEFELDPALAKRIRARTRLRQLTIRLSNGQIEAARVVAARDGVPYQTLLRKWILEGLRRARKRSA